MEEHYAVYSLRGDGELEEQILENPQGYPPLLVLHLHCKEVEGVQVSRVDREGWEGKVSASKELWEQAWLDLAWDEGRPKQNCLDKGWSRLQRQGDTYRLVGYFEGEAGTECSIAPKDEAELLMEIQRGYALFSCQGEAYMFERPSLARPLAF